MIARIRQWYGLTIAIAIVGCGTNSAPDGGARTADPVNRQQASELPATKDRKKSASSHSSEEAMPLPPEVIDSIRHLVWSGFYSADDILPIVAEDIYELDDAGTILAGKEIVRQFEKKTAAEKGWPDETTCDRLDSLFDDLNKNGIIALQNAGYTQSDGMSDITERYDELGGEKSGVIGYCFYHGQDLERAVDGLGLLLTFGDILGDDAKGKKIGEIIRDKVMEHGFKVEWDGSIKTRIQFAPFEWQRRGAGER
jgi:hypothetical protein